MRILHIHVGREFAGSETYAADLASRQAAAGLTVALLVRAGPIVARWRAQAKGVAVLVIPKWAKGPLERWVARHYAKGFTPEVLHSHLGGAHWLGERLKRVLKVPHVGTMHLRYKPAEHAGLDARVAIAQWQMAEVPSALQNRTKVVRNWVPAMPLRKSKPISDVFTFGSVGRLHPNKGMEDLLCAFKVAFPENKNVRLVLVGEGTERAAIEAAREGDTRIMLLGAVPAAPLYAEWDVYVSAARYEPFGLTLLEAMHQQLPIVATRTQGAEEIFATQSYQPVWAKPADVETLAEALRRAFETHKNSTGWDLTPFDPARALAQIETLYKELMA